MYILISILSCFKLIATWWQTSAYFSVKTKTQIRNSVRGRKESHEKKKRISRNEPLGTAAVVKFTDGFLDNRFLSFCRRRDVARRRAYYTRLRGAAKRSVWCVFCLNPSGGKQWHVRNEPWDLEPIQPTYTVIVYDGRQISSGIYLRIYWKSNDIKNSINFHKSNKKNNRRICYNYISG